MKRGFTLIELSIVLVIIGLIVGGIVAARELIIGATVRAQISQLERYQSAAHAFRLKYAYLPGDVIPARATQLGFFAETGPLAGTAGHQNGDGRHTLAEEGGFWRHLTDAQMIDGNFGTLTAGNELDPATGFYSQPTTPATIHRLYPLAKVGRNASFTVTSSPSIGSFFAIYNLSVDSGAPPGPSYTVTPLETYAVDRKLDDGFPASGKVRLGLLMPPCMNMVTSQYVIQLPTGDTPACILTYYAF